MKIKLSEIKGTESKRDHGNIEILKESIIAIGLINPITINQDFELMAGRRRYQAIKELGWQYVECQIINTESDFQRNYFENVNNKCELCSFPFADLHHILPKEYGGTEEKSNFIYLCSNHHRAIHFLIQLTRILQNPEKFKRKPKNILEIQTFLYNNDKQLINFYNKILKEKMYDQLRKRNKTKIV